MPLMMLFVLLFLAQQQGGKKQQNREVTSRQSRKQRVRRGRKQFDFLKSELLHPGVWVAWLVVVICSMYTTLCWVSSDAQ